MSFAHSSDLVTILRSDLAKPALRSHASTDSNATKCCTATCTLRVPLCRNAEMPTN